MAQLQKETHFSDGLSDTVMGCTHGNFFLVFFPQIQVQTSPVGHEKRRSAFSVCDKDLEPGKRYMAA